MLDEGVIPPLTCLRVLTLSWMGLGKPTRVSISLENNKHHYATLKEDNVSGIAYLSQMEYLLPQSETDEFVSTGLKEVLDVFLPAHTQILD